MGGWGYGVVRVYIVKAKAVNSNVMRTFTRTNVPILVGDHDRTDGRGTFNGVRGSLTGLIRGNGMARRCVSNTLIGVALAASCTSYTGYSLVVRTTIRAVRLGGRLFHRLSRVYGPRTVLTSGASSLSVARMTTTAGHPRHIVNVRFFGPTPIVGLIRLVHKRGASSRICGAVSSLTHRVNGRPIVMGRTPNFIIGHVLVPLIGRNVKVLTSNITSHSRVSTTVHLKTGRPVNPLTLNSLVNLSIYLTVVRILRHRFNSSGCHPRPLLHGVIHTNLLNHGANRKFCGCW